MIRLFHISLFFLITLSGMGQSIQIKIIDTHSGDAIENVHLSYLKRHAVTDKNGLAGIIVAQPTAISISHISYRDTIIYIGNISSQEYVFRLSPKVNALKGVEVNTKPLCLFAPEKTHVFDFELRNDTLLILTYTREKMWRRHHRQSEALYLGCSLLLVSPSGNILDSINLPHLIKSFYTNPISTSAHQFLNELPSKEPNQHISTWNILTAASGSAHRHINF